MEEHDWMVLHDVDQIPEIQANSYAKPLRPKHLVSRTSQFNYRPVFEDLAGGATIMTHEMYEQTGGFSNCFWGWGGEDENMAERIVNRYGKLERNSPELGRYTALEHQHDPRLDKTRQYKANTAQSIDGFVDGLRTLRYAIYDKRVKTYGACNTTWITADIMNRCNLLTDGALTQGSTAETAIQFFLGVLLGVGLLIFLDGIFRLNE